MTYVLYKVGKRAGANDNVLRIMANDNVDVLRQDANKFFADPDEFVGRTGEQLIIPEGALQSNVVVTAAGDQEYHRYVEIREIKG